MRKASFNCLLDDIDPKASFVNQTFALTVRVMTKYLQVAQLEFWSRAMNYTKSWI